MRVKRYSTESLQISEDNSISSDRLKQLRQLAMESLDEDIMWEDDAPIML